MKTNETVVMALQRAAEDELQGLVRQLTAADAISLKALERAVMQAIFRLGRRWLEVVLSWRTEQEPAPARRHGPCGHQHRLVGWRPKQLLTLLGTVSWSRPYYHCQVGCDAVGHGEAPADAAVGVAGRRTSAGVQEAVGYLAAFLPLAEVALNVSRLLPLQVSARQVLALIQPVGEALRAQEDAQVAALWTEAARSRTDERGNAGQGNAGQGNAGQGNARLYVEMDGIMARLRRGSVPFEGAEAAGAGDVYREVKVGTVFRGVRGPDRSTLAPGQWVDTLEQVDRSSADAATDVAGPTRYVARRTTAATFGPLLYRLAVAAGLPDAREVVVLGDGAAWIWGWPRSTSPARCRSSICGMRSSTSGRWLTPRGVAARPPQRPGRRRRVAGWRMATWSA